MEVDELYEGEEAAAIEEAEAEELDTKSAKEASFLLL